MSPTQTLSLARPQKLFAHRRPSLQKLSVENVKGNPSLTVPLRAKVARSFNGRWYEGEVTQVIPPAEDDTDPRPWYRVEYGDGDREDLSPLEALEAAAAHRGGAPGLVEARAAVLPSARERCYSASKLRDPARKQGKIYNSSTRAEAGDAPPVRLRRRELTRPSLRYDPVTPSALDTVLLADLDPNKAARLLLALRPLVGAAEAKEPAEPKPVAPSRFRKNHQAMTKPFQLPDGTFPCARGCGRCFSHAPAAVAHSKACKHG